MESITPETLEVIKEKINQIINESSDIDERQEEIIRLRFGLDENGPIKIKDLSKRFDVSPKKMKKEIDVIEKKVFNKLKRII